MTLVKISRLLVLLWLLLVGGLLWQASIRMNEPPSMDTLSYVLKAKNVWENFYSKSIANPFDVAPAVRPPGTVLVSYPFGFSAEFAGYYFRATFVPIFLLALAAFVSAQSTSAKIVDDWFSVFVAASLVSMPMLYQFQATASMPSVSSMGMMDNAQAGVSALAAAAALLSVHRRSLKFAFTAALLASLSFLLKPSGVAVMAAVGFGWLAACWDRGIFSHAAWRSNETRRFFVLGISSATAVYVAVLWVALNSEYLSNSTFQIGSDSLKVMRSMMIYWSLDDLPSTIQMLRVSVGIPLLLFLFLGLVGSFVFRTSMGTGVVGLATLGFGFWFWAVVSGLSVARYFAPFAAVAAVFSIPGLRDLVLRLPRSPRLFLYTAGAVPVLLITSLLILPTRTTERFQKELGINLTTSCCAAETTQGSEFLRKLTESENAVSIYVIKTTEPVRNFESSIVYENLVRNPSQIVGFLRPTDWIRPNAIRIDELLSADYVATDTSPQIPAPELSNGLPITHELEVQLFNQAFNAATTEAGISEVSKTRVRISKIVDAIRLERTLYELVHDKTFTPTFEASNPRRWWTSQELQDESLSLNFRGTICFSEEASEQCAYSIRGVGIEEATDQTSIKVWVETGSAAPTSKNWQIFVHMLDTQSNIMDSRALRALPYHADTEQPSTSLRLYTFTFRPVSNASRIGVGFFRANGSSIAAMLSTKNTFAASDLDGRRLLVPIRQP
jgi:hypothetical protein